MPDKKVTEMPSAVPGAPAGMPFNPNNVLFAAVVDPARPGVVSFWISDAMVGPEMQPGAVFHILGQLRTMIRQYAVQKGNPKLGDGL